MREIQIAGIEWISIYSETSHTDHLYTPSTSLYGLAFLVTEIEGGVSFQRCGKFYKSTTSLNGPDESTTDMLGTRVPWSVCAGRLNGRSGLRMQRGDTNDENPSHLDRICTVKAASAMQLSCVCVCVCVCE